MQTMERRGRPAKTETERGKTVAVILYGDEIALLKERAQQEERSFSQVLRMVLRRGLELEKAA